MTHEETEQIIKEAVIDTWNKVYPNGESFQNIKGVTTLEECITVAFNNGGYGTFHWREYFLSHEFCKEWFGEEDFSEAGHYAKRWIYHVKKLVLCKSLQDVAIYLKNNPKIK